MLNIPSLLLFALIAAVPARAQAPSGRAASSRDVEMKVTLESVMEKRLETVLRKVLASNDVFVVANVELLADADRPDVEVLPGVVVKKTPASAAPMELPASLVKRVTISVFLSDSISAANIDLARATAQRMVGIKPERGDVLNVEKVRTPPVVLPARPTFLDQAQASSPRYALMLTCLLAACWGLIYISRRFFDPLIIVLREAAQNLAKAGAKAGERGQGDPGKEAAQNAPPEAAGLPAEKSAAADPEARKLPFSFIKDRDVPALELLLLDQTDVTAAIIVQYLPPALAARALAGMTSSRREMVLAYMSKPAIINQFEVKKIEELIMSKIDYVMGGEEKLVSMLDHASISMQAEMLETVRQRDPELGARLDARVVLIDDIGLLDEAGLTALSRHATVRGMAVVLKSLPHLSKGVLAKLKTGFGEWLSQETALIGDLPENVKEAEMRLVLQALVKLVRSGKVNLHKETLLPPPGAYEPDAADAPTEIPADRVK